MSKILTEEEEKLVLDTLRLLKGLEKKLKVILGQ